MRIPAAPWIVTPGGQPGNYLEPPTIPAGMTLAEYRKSRAKKDKEKDKQELERSELGGT